MAHGFWIIIPLVGIWIWVNCNKIPALPILYLLKGDYSLFQALLNWPFGVCLLLPGWVVLGDPPNED